MICKKLLCDNEVIKNKRGRKRYYCPKHLQLKAKNNSFFITSKDKGD